ncbi:DUF202 domain-containing protein [Corynebacterium hylobatis]|uniref:DUF202 domain-containing protein n=1 Tax=Corynebacterium hylobatis TaxID=1859290 RepID=A0A3R9ZJD7_9CORY|nr:DUF202 domain-containing protein [Corynebacterium hylobatis]RSZ63918.1 DUF202 domain-containing protein [Corynebacterium hylobatis]
MSTPLIHDDPGLQPERTTLAWTRTTVSYAVCSAILLRWLPHYGFYIVALIGLMVAMAFGIYATQRARHHTSVQGLVAGRVRAQVGAVVTMTLALIGFGVAGIILILIS